MVPLQYKIHVTIKRNKFGYIRSTCTCIHTQPVITAAYIHKTLQTAEGWNMQVTLGRSRRLPGVVLFEIYNWSNCHICLEL